eukprot:6212921-Pleurochrysis_carterae.AAC.3
MQKFRMRSGGMLLTIADTSDPSCDGWGCIACTENPCCLCLTNTSWRPLNENETRLASLYEANRKTRFIPKDARRTNVAQHCLAPSKQLCATHLNTVGTEPKAVPLELGAVLQSDYSRGVQPDVVARVDGEDVECTHGLLLRCALRCGRSRRSRRKARFQLVSKDADDCLNATHVLR